MSHRFSTAACFAVLALAASAAEANADPIVMKISLPTINENVHEVAKSLAARVEKDSGGRIKPEIYPASQLGSIPRQIEGTQFGSIQCAIIPPEFFSGIDQRFEVMAAPGLVDSMDNARKTAADPAVLKLMLGLGADKGLHGAGMFVALPSYAIAKTPIRHLADFKGKKLRVLASDFQTAAFQRIGVTPVAMTLGDVLPAIQQGAIDGAISGMPVFTSMHYQDAAKYVTTTGQPYIFIIIEYSAKWVQSLPADLQKVVDAAAAAEGENGAALGQKYLDSARHDWVAAGAELIDLPKDEEASMMQQFAAAAQEVAGKRPDVAAAYKIVTDAAKRDK
ncbi:MAG TPA: TRAP transporter substrate-binding protein [Stellaceae bacterium]|nr:TRAP transporter substrate-binding protein [Stellaceae bacterium]